MTSISIDFGTTNSVAAMNKDGLLTIIPTSQGRRVIPSIVSFSDRGEIFVGENARSNIIPGKTQIIFSIKKYLGTDKKFKINNKNYTPVEITSFILKYIKNEIEKYIGHKIPKVVITAPAYFKLNQRQALSDACHMADLQLEDIINEPTSAAIAYGVTQINEQNIIVYDLGGGTFDVSLVKFLNNKFNVLSVTGDNNLGGDDFDLRIVNLIVQKIRKDHNINITNNPLLLYKLKEEAEKAKIQLSESEVAHLTFPFLNLKKTDGLIIEINRDLFKAMIKPFIERTIVLMNEAIINAGLSPQQIDKVLLVGGSTRIPLVKEMIHNYFLKDIYLGMNPNECVALGAALHAHSLKSEKRSIILNDIIPFSLGIEADGGLFIPIIKKNSRIPVSASRIFTPIIKKQKNIEIQVFQGESKKTSENIFLGNLVLKNIGGKKISEMPKIEVKFTVDESSLIHITAIDLLTGKSRVIKLTSTPKPAVKILKDHKKINRILSQKELIAKSKFIVKSLKHELKKQDTDNIQKYQIKILIKEIKLLKKKKEYNKLEEKLNFPAELEQIPS
ncbi:MAG: Hsp70 family protein [Spirochaetes bacterium]|nr:Hsp70 family protein [Spirochaetota bacterium]